MKITTLIENTSSDPMLSAEHGLSLYLETENQKILFDMGQTSNFACNAERLGIDLSQVDFAVLSHGHYDHGRGLATFLRRNSHAPVYVHKTAFGAYYNGTEKYIGLDPSLQSNPRLVYTEGNVAITPRIFLRDCNDLGWISQPYGLNRREEDRFEPDDFRHEQYLQIWEGEKQIVISGCSHKGILNIAEYFRPQVLIGGFHLNKVEDPMLLRQIGERLLRTNTLFFTGHCTGSKQFAIMKEVMGENLQSLSAGTVIER